MKTNELIRWLKRRHVQFDYESGKGGHITLLLGNRRSRMSHHGNRKEVPTGTVERIKKEPGLR